MGAASFIFPRLTRPSPRAFLPYLFRLRGGIPALVSVSHGQCRHFAGAGPRSCAQSVVARPSDERVLPGVRRHAGAGGDPARPLRPASRRARAVGHRRQRRRTVRVRRIAHRTRAGARGHRRRRVRMPDGAAEGDRHVVSAERQASYSGWIMVAGGIGALVATAPLEFALRIAHWRTCSSALPS